MSQHTQNAGVWACFMLYAVGQSYPQLIHRNIQFAQASLVISMDDGEIFTYALGKLDDRGRMLVKANDPVYEGMIVGIHNRDNDLVVNATRTKQLTNFRVSGKEDAVKTTPPIALTLEYGVEFIEDDELVEITPKSVRLRKRFLKEHERKRAGRDTSGG